MAFDWIAFYVLLFGPYNMQQKLNFTFKNYSRFFLKVVKTAQITFIVIQTTKLFINNYFFDPDWLSANIELTTMNQLLVVAEWRYLLETTCWAGLLNWWKVILEIISLNNRPRKRLENSDKNVVAQSVAVNNPLRENLLFAFVSLII